MSTLAIWCRVVQSLDVSLHNFDGLAMSGLAFSVALCYLQRKNVQFFEQNMSPQNSPDLNPVDYAIWCVLQQRSFTLVNEQLKRAIIDA